MQPRSKLLLISVAVIATAILSSAAVAWAITDLRMRLDIGHEVAVRLDGELPIRATIAKPLAVSIDERMTANVRISELSIPIDERMEVPIKMTIDVPIDSEIDIDQDLPISMNVPIDIVLTERELDLSKLEIPIDTDIFVEDEIELDMVVPIETEVTTTLGITVPVKMRVPIKTKVPIRQKIHVRDTLKLGMKKLRLPLKMNIPVHAVVPLTQRIRVQGKVRAPIDQRISVPIQMTVHPKLEAITATVQLAGNVPAKLEGDLEAKVMFDRPLAAKLGSVRIGIEDVAIERR